MVLILQKTLTHVRDGSLKKSFVNCPNVLIIVI